MKPIADFLESLAAKRATLPALLIFLAVLFATGNLPWHLDNYDQAKQAYTAFEIAKTGNLWLQHTPQGATASKPPLMAWTSAALHASGVPWDIAWRLPSFVCALAVLGILVKTGSLLLGRPGAVIAASAFGLNLLTPRLATLVRTDMMLAAFIFLLGWMIHRKLLTLTPWTTAERWLFCGAMTGALLTKGPVVYAFLLPGWIAFLIFGGKNRRLIWSGWWTWVLPLLLFVAWGVAGLVSDPNFYHDVVDHEFLSRFQEGARDDERPQPFWFYFPHLLHKFAPWSLVLIGLAIALPQLRRGLRDKPATFWLVLWSLGGLVVMTLVPAKRVDRIYPLIPPFCLLLVDWCALSWENRRVRVTIGAAIVGACLFAGGYFIGLIPLSYHEGTPALVEFAEKAGQTAKARGFDHVTLPRSRDEGLLLYLDTTGFADKGDSFDRWKAGDRMALLITDRSTRGFFEKVGKVEPALDSGELHGKNEKRYYLFIQE